MQFLAAKKIGHLVSIRATVSFPRNHGCLANRLCTIVFCLPDGLTYVFLSLIVQSVDPPPRHAFPHERSLQRRRYRQAQRQGGPPHPRQGPREVQLRHPGNLALLTRQN